MSTHSLTICLLFALCSNAVLLVLLMLQLHLQGCREGDFPHSDSVFGKRSDNGDITGAVKMSAGFPIDTGQDVFDNSETLPSAWITEVDDFVKTNRWESAEKITHYLDVFRTLFKTSVHAKRTNPDPWYTVRSDSNLPGRGSWVWSGYPPHRRRRSARRGDVKVDEVFSTMSQQQRQQFTPAVSDVLIPALEELEINILR